MKKNVYFSVHIPFLHQKLLSKNNQSLFIYLFLINEFYFKLDPNLNYIWSICIIIQWRDLNPTDFHLFYRYIFIISVVGFGRTVDYQHMFVVTQHFSWYFHNPWAWLDLHLQLRPTRVHIPFLISKHNLFPSSTLSWHTPFSNLQSCPNAFTISLHSNKINNRHDVYVIPFILLYPYTSVAWNKRELE